MSKNDKSADLGKINFETALGELEEIVRDLESGSGDLDEAIKAYARGAHLKRHCENKLKDAQARIDKIVLGPDGDVDTESLDSE